MLRHQEPNSDLVAGYLVGQQLANLPLKAGRIARLGALFASGTLGLDLLGCVFRATGVEFFLQTKVTGGPLDAANANEMVGLLELLSDDLGRKHRDPENDDE